MSNQRIYLVTMSGEDRGVVTDVQVSAGLWSARSSEEALGLAMRDFSERYPRHAVKGRPAVTDMSDQVRAWVSANPTSGENET